MSLSRTRTRFAALGAAVPVLIAGSPLLAAPAVAADATVRQAQLVETQGKLRIGPRAGFRGDVARGVNGNTAIVAFDTTSSSVVEKVSVAVSQSGPFSIYDDFDATDGFAIYKDLDDNDRLDLADYEAGPVSLPRYDIGFSGGTVVVTVTADQAKATGEDSYLVTVHPAANLAAERDVNFSVPANGIETSTGDIPAATLDLATILLDSKAPAAIPVTNFTPVSRPPAENCPSADPADCGDDAYKVHRATAAEQDEKLGFFNAAGDLSDGALLQRADGAGTVAAIYDVAGISGASQTPTSLSIGNGTGRDSSAPGSRALNNQISDDVFAVQWDPIGNVAVTTLTNTAPCDQNVATPTCGVHPPRGNDVTAPAVASTVTIEQINAATPNLASVKVESTITAGADQGVHPNVKRTPIAQIAYPEHVTQVPGSNPPQYTRVEDHVGAEKRSTETYIPGTTTAPNNKLTSLVDVTSNTLFPQDGLVRGLARLVDAYGNAAPEKATAAVMKDTIRPAFVKASLIDSNGNGTAEQGEVYRVEFNDGMDTDDINSSNVNSRLTVARPNETCNGLTVVCVNWGEGATTTWMGENKLLSITLGKACSSLGPDCDSLNKLPQTGDIVTAVAAVTDKNQNAFATGTNTVTIAQPAALPLAARTVDSVNVGENVFATGRDGVLDAIDVEFTSALNGGTISSTSWEVKSGDKTIVPTVTAGAANDTIRLTFTVPATDKALFGTGATPTVTLTNNVLKSSTNGDIAPFTLTALDRVAPVPVVGKTNDSNNDGFIDRVLLTYSEAIVHGKENPCGYWVTGYGDSTYIPSGFAPVGPTKCPVGQPGNVDRNQPSPGTPGATASDTVALKLKTLSTHDTHATPQFSFSYDNDVPSGNPTGSVPNEDCMTNTLGTVNAECPVLDAAGNRLNSFTGTAVDAAGPAIVERTTADTNSDGRLDEVRIKYSENLSTPSIANAQFTLSDPTYTIESLGVIGARDLALRLENIAAGKGDTGITPKLTGLGGTTDVAGTATTADAGVVVTDKAGPAIIGACSSSAAGTNGLCPVDDATNDKVTVLFSETVTAGTAAVADFVVEQPAGTAKTATAHAVETDNKRVTLTFAQGAIASDVDGVVRLAAAGAVTDAAAAPNPSTQVTNVPLFKVPSVTLDITCPSPANPGYCTTTTVNTGAAGTAGVTRWRLAETPRSTTPADSEFVDAIPATYTLPEGTHTLYLSGKDEFGRLTPEVSDTITVLKAPKILNFQLVNSETPRLPGSWADTSTVRDGDILRIGADAYGTDAAQWAANSAPAGGGCLSAHMQINLKSLTRFNSDTALAPLQCDLRTTTEQPYRQMQFPLRRVSGTTKYPVGTVVKVSDSDPGSIIVDGSNGSQLRRPFISVNARRSWMITDASVIKVSTSMVNGLAKGSNVGYRNGALLRSSTGYYYVENGVKRPVSTTQLSAWRMSTSTAYRPTSTELKRMPTGARITGAAHAAGTWIKYTDGRIYQVVKNAQGKAVRRQLANRGALRTLVPSTHIYPANSSDSRLSTDSWLIGYRDGTLLKMRDGTYSVVARGSLRRFANPATFNTLGYATSNAIAANSAAMSRVPGQTYRTGATIDRYKITTAAIKVTNKAGASVSVTVIPSLAGIYGVGTLDAVPAGWDFTR